MFYFGFFLCVCIVLFCFFADSFFFPLPFLCLTAEEEWQEIKGACCHAYPQERRSIFCHNFTTVCMRVREVSALSRPLLLL